MSLLGLALVTLMVVAGIVVYKLWKSGKAVTGAAVVAGVEADVKVAANTAESAVANTVSKL